MGLFVNPFSKPNGELHHVVIPLEGAPRMKDPTQISATKEEDAEKPASEKSSDTWTSQALRAALDEEIAVTEFNEIYDR